MIDDFRKCSISGVSHHLSTSFFSRQSFPRLYPDRGISFRECTEGDWVHLSALSLQWQKRKGILFQSSTCNIQWMYTCVYILYIYMCVCIRYIYIYTWVHNCNIYLYTLYIYIYMYIYIAVCVCVNITMCIHVCVYMYICILMYLAVRRGPVVSPGSKLEECRVDMTQCPVPQRLYTKGVLYFT